MKKVFMGLFLGILCLATSAGATGFTARFTFDDGSPVAGKVVILRIDTPADVVVGSYLLDAQGFVSSDIDVDPAANYRAQLIAPEGNIIQEVWTLSPSSSLVSAVLAVMGSGEVDVVLLKNDQSIKSVVFVSFGTILTFDNPTPPGDPGSQIFGVYKDIHWHSGTWTWQEASGPDRNINIHLDPKAGTSGSFRFKLSSVLQSMRLFSKSAGTLTLSSDQGETKTEDISADRLLTVSTGWTKPAKKINVTFTAGSDLGIDQLTYR
jgi:hypothetical protein